MSLTKTKLDETRHSITYLFTEAGDAVGELAVNVIADLAAGPLKTLLQTPVADAAAARALVYENIDVIVSQRAGSAGDSCHLCLDFDDATTVFEMNAICAKGGDTDTGEFVVTLRLRHSLVA
ncbi:MAG: hypothetical protein KIT75_03500 [Planctomycetota bacterium]|nr:hypothetical protein [Planctomycetota bacterium]